jgi:hypothetical protein
MRPSISRRVAALLAAALVACAPPLNWRETRPPGSGVAMLFPCRPDPQERTIQIAGAALRMRMHSCRAAGAEFSLVFADVAEPASVTPLLAAMRAAAQANLDGTSTARPLAPAGATPNEQSTLMRIDGRLPDRRRIVEHVAFFARGLRVYQVTALGESLDAEAIETFFDSIKVVT